MKSLIIAAFAATVALAASAGTARAQGPDVVPIGYNAAGQQVCPSNYVVQGNVCVSIHAGRRGGPDSVPIGRNAAGQAQCPSNFVIRGNACVSIYAKGAGGGYDSLPPGRREGHRDERGYRDERFRDERGYRDERFRDDGYRRERYREEYPPRPRAAVRPMVNWRGELQCPSNYVIRGDLCVSLY